MRSALQRRVRAQVFAITAVVMVAMVGALALVVDVGMFVVVQRQFQAAADAGALAGAWYQPVCVTVAVGCKPGDASAVAEQVAEANARSMAGLCGGTDPAATVEVGTTLNLPARVNAIVVTVDCRAGYSFGRILGLSSARISASSAAAIGSRTVDREMGDMPSSGPCVSPPPLPPVPNCEITFPAPPTPPVMTCVAGATGNPPCLIARLIE
jgi:hypothetical protein